MKIITGVLWMLAGSTYIYKTFVSGDFIWASLSLVYIGFGWHYIEHANEGD